MKYKTFLLIDAIRCEGLDNGQWNIFWHFSHVGTKVVCGTKEDHSLPVGIWIAVYKWDHERMGSIDRFTPDLRLSINDKEEVLLFNVSD
uniref:hypothetical protein n=1 Tax=Prevotella sp. TaxID=59823 RepID=UPI00402773D8